MGAPGPSLAKLEKRLGYRFQTADFLREALTHASALEAEQAHNERLEFLGDAVLNLVVAEILYARYPGAREGRLTELKAQLVARSTVERVAQNLKLGSEIRTGGGLETRGSLPRSVLGNAMEAVLGAIYLDSNQLQVCHECVGEWWHHEIEQLEDLQVLQAAKQKLQAWAQAECGVVPVYEVQQTFDHPETKAFLVVARIGAREFAGAWGTTKKHAERLAAWEALLQLNLVGPDHAA
jgi:ribonuclease III